MKSIFRKIVLAYYRILGALVQRRRGLYNFPVRIDLGPPWKSMPVVVSASSLHGPIQRRYLRAGRAIGSAVAELYLGECVGFEGLLDEWEASEVAYAAMGFRTLPIEAFVDYGGYAIPLTGVGLFRAPGERAICHAGLYRKYFFGKEIPLHVRTGSGGVVFSSFVSPRTGDLDLES